MMKSTANDKFLERWDEEYKKIVANYGSGEDFVNAHIADYNIYRSNVLIFISRLQELARGVDRAMKYLEKEFTTDKNYEVMIIKLGAMRGSITSAINNLADDTQHFVEGEEAAHSETKEVKEILEKLKKEIKEINFYE